MNDQLLYNLANRLCRHASSRPDGAIAGLMASGDLSDLWLTACKDACVKTDLIGCILLLSLEALSPSEREALLGVYHKTHFVVRK
jgi:hypothetical protein